MIELLVRVLERDGCEFSPHSSLRRLLALAFARELDLAPPRIDALELAALLGGLGELCSPAGAGGADSLATTVQLLRGVPLPAGVRGAIAHQHERWDGAGPHGLRGERIPLLARILAVARAGAGLLATSPDVATAVQELERQAGSAFDPVVVSVLRRVFARRERHGIGYCWGGRIVVAHPQERRALDLAVRLQGHGYRVETAVGAGRLREQLRKGAPHALVLAAELPDGGAESLVGRLRKVPALAGLPVVVIDAADAERRVGMFRAGADLCLGPEVEFAELKASLDALLRRWDALFPREGVRQVVSP
ncbi:MAG TPA: HD domain-containing phosphohydrolase [Longimicrobiaceae bacterium]|nr:HD domain-containing phosphohydrolase [Longimicrobiaceae bacterium]